MAGTWQPGANSDHDSREDLHQALQRSAQGNQRVDEARRRESTTMSRPRSLSRPSSTAYSLDREHRWSAQMEAWIVIGIIVIIAVWAIAGYNNLINLRNRVRNAFAQIDVQLTRRHDLVPNLVEAVKGYMKHERETLTAVIDARNTAVAGLRKAAADPANAEAIKELGAAEATLGGTLGRLFALAESYPDLKASQNMMQFQEELSSTENRVAFARQAFNDSVMSYNNACENFPSNLIANTFSFKHAEFLDIGDEQKREAPQVSFG